MAMAGVQRIFKEETKFLGKPEMLVVEPRSRNYCTQHPATANDLRISLGGSLVRGFLFGERPWRRRRPACIMGACPITLLSLALPHCASEPMPAAPWRKQATTLSAKHFGSHGQGSGKNSR